MLSGLDFYLTINKITKYKERFRQKKVEIANKKKKKEKVKEVDSKQTGFY